MINKGFIKNEIQNGEFPEFGEIEEILKSRNQAKIHGIPVPPGIPGIIRNSPGNPRNSVGIPELGLLSPGCLSETKNYG